MSARLLLGDCRCVASDARGVTLDCAPGLRLRLEAVHPAIIHLRLATPDDDSESALIRYGFYRRDWSPVPVEVTESADKVTLTTASVRVDITTAPCRLSFFTAAGDLLTREPREPGAGVGDGFTTQFTLAEGERIIGFGDQTRERLEHRGTVADMWIENVTSYVPIPFFMSDRGYGVVLNTTWRHRYDVGASSPDLLRVEGVGGPLDYYLLVGSDYRRLLELYTLLTGRAPLPPLWSFGLWFISRTQADCKEFLDDCLNFRREGIPCDAISLEPGWMAKNYDFSVDKTWHPDRFPIPSYAQLGPTNFLDAARRMGFKPGLWLCNDYDLSWEEERQVRRTGTGEADSTTVSADGHEVDEHLQHGVRLDKLTKPDEPWFEHLKKFIDQGVEYFKQDGANQVLPHPDRKWANGMDDAEMHNLYPLLYSKQMHQGFRDYTGRRPTSFTVAGWAGSQRWTGTWAGDTGGGPGPLAASLNLSVAGLVYTTCDMEVQTKAGIHFGFLQPWAQVNSWNYWRHPWLLGDELKPIFRDYARLRMQLLPYLYSTGHEAWRTGWPILRALPLDFPDDARAYEILTEYLLGPWLLVGAFTESCYLPAGTWIDFWTGECHEGPKEFQPSVPDSRGGPLFVRAGALLPLAPVMDYVGQKPWDPVTWDVYPQGETSFTLIEDDGITPDYEQGRLTETTLTCRETAAGIRLDLSPRTGSYPGMLRQRTFLFTIHCDRPEEVRVDGELLAHTETEGAFHAGESGWRYDAALGVLWIRLPESTGQAQQIAVGFGS